MNKEVLINIEQNIYEVFNRRYIVVGMLGSGGMGCVFYARSNDALEIERAIKVLNKKEYNENLDILAEAYALKKLDHPCIPKVIEILEHDDYVYIVQEYIKGDSLKTIVKKNGKISEKHFLNWMDSIASTVKYLHDQGIIHRDIKPDNIMLTPDGQIKIIDFGLARSRTEVDEVDEKVIGTLSYTAPERFLKKNATVQTDIYGFGTTIYLVATGLKPESMRKHPKRGLSIMKGNLKKFVTPGVGYILEKSIDVDPNQRYYSFDQILYDIAKVEPFNQSLKKQKSKERLIMTGLIFGLCLFSTTIVFGFNQLKIEKEDKYKGIINYGTELLGTGKVEESKSTFESGIQLIPNAMAAHQGVMEVYTSEKNYDEVIKYGLNLLQEKKEAKESGEVAYLIGNAYYELGKFEQATPYLQDGVEKSPIVEHNLVLGMNYCGLEEYDKAQEVVNSFESTVENTDAANYLLAQIGEKQGQMEQAKDYYKTVISKTDKETLRRKAYLSLARLYKLDKNYTEMVALLEAFQTELAGKVDIAANEYLGEAYYALAKAGQTQYYDKAKAVFQNLIELGYLRPYIYRNIAIINQEMGNNAEALVVLDQMILEYPEDYTADLQKTWVLIQIENDKANEARDYSDAKASYDQMMEIVGDNASDVEVQMLTSKINEIKSKGW